MILIVFEEVREDQIFKEIVMRALNFSKLSEKGCKWNLSLRSNLRMVLGSWFGGRRGMRLLRFARNDRGRSVKTVSYTHLTLPTTPYV